MNFARTWDLLTRQHAAEIDQDAGPYEGSNREATEKEMGRYLTAPLLVCNPDSVMDTDTVRLREHIRQICDASDQDRMLQAAVEASPDSEQ